MNLLLRDQAATVAFGKRLGRAVLAQVTVMNGPDTAQAGAANGIMIHLLGELGAGKTTLARGILRAWGHDGAVKSPTYTLVEPYDLQPCPVYHFDLYRLEAGEADYLGVEDYFGERALCIIEWADKAPTTFPAPDLTLALETRGSGRGLELRTHTPKGAAIVERLSRPGRNP